MKVVALTGGIGSGKSTVLKEFGKLGAEIISCDEVSHRIMLRGGIAYPEVVSGFGKEVLDNDGEIDRKILADMVFSDKDKLTLLNNIMHRLIYSEINLLIRKSSAEVLCVEIPLLFTAECPIHLDGKMAVTAPSDIRRKRGSKRDKSSTKQLEARIANQLSDEEMSKKADIVIENTGDLETLKTCVAQIYYSLI